VGSSSTQLERYSLLRTGGGAVLLFGIVFGLYALNMDTSVETAFGRVNNIGLLNDQQNYIIVAGIATLAGLIMMVMARRETTRQLVEQTAAASTIDPFDALDIEKANEQKRYAISLGITRGDSKFTLGNSTYESLEAAIAAAEARAAA
jgi:hypothetical protein